MASWFSWFSSFRTKQSVEECTGSYSVGSTDYMSGPMRDTSPENSESDVQGLFIRLFYPSHETHHEHHKRMKWLSERVYTDSLIDVMNWPIPVWLLSSFFYWLAGSANIPAVWNAPLLSTGDKDKDKLPCVVFSHALAGNRLVYANFCCELASQGCVVAIVEHRDKSASVTCVLRKCRETKRVIEKWLPYYHIEKSDDEFRLRNSQMHHRVMECVNAADILEKLNAGSCPENLLGNNFDLLQFKGRLDLNKRAVMGHSFGGTTTISALVKDNRFKCGIGLDAWMLPLDEEIFIQKIQQPLLFINSELFHRWDVNMKKMKRLLETNEENLKVIAIRGIGHFNQSDIHSVLPERLLKMTMLGWLSHLDQETAIRLNRQAIWAFLQRHLAIGQPAQHEPILDGGKGAPDHVVIGPELDERDTCS